MKKRCTGSIRHGIVFFALFFAVCCVALLSGGQKTEAATEGFWEFYDVDGGVRIVGYTGDLPVVEIPSSLGGKTVVEIGEDAFHGKKMHTVKIPSTVHTIAYGWYGCFSGCESLMTVEGLENVKIIGDNAFNSCISLTNLTFSSDLSYIGQNAFYNTNLTGNISLPASVETIGYRAFADCKYMTSVTVPAKVTHWEKNLS